MVSVEITTHLDAPPEVVRDHVNMCRLFVYVTSGFLSLRPVDPPQFPKQWSEGHYRVRLQLLGIIPIGWQRIGIENPGPGDEWVVRDNGSGSVARTWDHYICVDADGPGTRYTDRIRVDAGLLTPVVALFASLLFRYRQHRWRRLVRHGFDYDR